ncbi:hypothetical protein RUM43_000746 [Polyplax serrata]|uniref:Uncharacterized protein n=1 Tax=Polyplax serrata TaxID=468196 RepID=A0AAN8SED0_POLSC
MEEEQYEAIIVNPDMREEDFVTTVNGSNIGVMELGKRLLLAAKEGNTESVRNLMKGGAPFATDWLGTTSLHAAAAGGHLETCELLLRSGILKDARTKVEKTPLHMACQEGHCEVALLLLANGADVNASDMLQMTPLHWAVEREKLGTIKVLLQNGADPTMVNKFDKTCYDIANDSERHDIIEILQNEPRKGEYTVVGKKKTNVQMRPSARILTTKSPQKPIEIVNGTVNKNLDRPKTAIILPTYQNKKGSVTVKKIKNEEEQRNRLATLQLLEEHGIEMLEGEDINLVASAVGSGQTIVLTEAGKQALSLTASRSTKVKPLKRPSTDSTLELTPIKSSTKLSTDKLTQRKKFLKIDKSPGLQMDTSIEDINKKFEEAKREAEQYKELYARKQREAEEYRNKLETITLSVCSTQPNDEEDEDEECDEEEPEDEEGIDDDFEGDGD